MQGGGSNSKVNRVGHRIDRVVLILRVLQVESRHRLVPLRVVICAVQAVPFPPPAAVLTSRFHLLSNPHRGGAEAWMLGDAGRDEAWGRSSLGRSSLAAAGGAPPRYGLQSGGF